MEHLGWRMQQQCARWPLQDQPSAVHDGIVFESALVDMRGFATIPQLSCVDTVCKCWAFSQVTELCVNVDNFELWKKFFVFLF